MKTFREQLAEAVARGEQAGAEKAKTEARTAWEMMKKCILSMARRNKYSYETEIHEDNRFILEELRSLAEQDGVQMTVLGENRSMYTETTIHIKFTW